MSVNLELGKPISRKCYRYFSGNDIHVGTQCIYAQTPFKETKEPSLTEWEAKQRRQKNLQRAVFSFIFLIKPTATNKLCQQIYHHKKRIPPSLARSLKIVNPTIFQRINILLYTKSINKRFREHLQQHVHLVRSCSSKPHPIREP